MKCLKLSALCAKRVLLKSSMENPAEKVRVILRIEGRVQGVFFAPPPRKRPAGWG